MENPVLNKILLVVSVLGVLFFTIYGLYSFTDFWRDFLLLETKSIIPTLTPSSPSLSSAIFTDESGLFSLKYDSQKYSIEKQTVNPLSALPTSWISNTPQEKSTSITVNRLVDKSGQEIFSFYLEEVPFAKKINSINKSGPHFVEQEISPFSLTETAGYKVKRTIVLPDSNQNEQDANVAFTEYLYLLPVKNKSKSLIIVIPFNNQEHAEELIGEFLKV